MNTETQSEFNWTYSGLRVWYCHRSKNPRRSSIYNVRATITEDGNLYFTSNCVKGTFKTLQEAKKAVESVFPVFSRSLHKK